MAEPEILLKLTKADESAGVEPNGSSSTTPPPPPTLAIDTSPNLQPSLPASFSDETRLRQPAAFSLPWLRRKSLPTDLTQKPEHISTSPRSPEILTPKSGRIRFTSADHVTVANPMSTPTSPAISIPSSPTASTGAFPSRIPTTPISSSIVNRLAFVPKAVRARLSTASSSSTRSATNNDDNAKNSSTNDSTLGATARRLVEERHEMIQWYLGQCQCNVFTGLLFIRSHADQVFQAFLRSATLNRQYCMSGGRIFVITNEPLAQARQGWVADSGLEIMYDETHQLAKYLMELDLISIRLNMGPSQRIVLSGPAVLFVSQQGRTLFSWSRQNDRENPWFDRTTSLTRVDIPEIILRKVQRVLLEVEGVTIVPMQSNQIDQRSLPRLFRMLFCCNFSFMSDFDDVFLRNAVDVSESETTRNSVDEMI